jgi:hypothetical protein
VSARLLLTSWAELSEDLMIAGWDWSEQDPEQSDDSYSLDEEFQIDHDGIYQFSDDEDEFEEEF